MRIFISAVLILFSLPLLAQNPANPLLRLFLSGNYQGVLGSKLEKGSVSGLESLVILKSLNRLNDAEKAIQFTEQTVFPESDTLLLAEWKYESAIPFLSTNRPADALTLFLDSYRLNPIPGTGSAISNLMTSSLSLQEITGILQTRKVKPDDPWLPWLRMAALNTGKKGVVDSWLIKHGVKPEKLPIANTSTSPLKKYRIGVLLPVFKDADSLDGSEEYGRDLLRGFLLRMEENAAHWGPSVTVLFRDSSGDPELAGKLAEELIVKEEVNLIFGPLFSDECERVREVAIRHRVPVITPTATSEALFTNSSWLFSMNSTMEFRGRFIAEQVRPLVEEGIKMSKVGSVKILGIAEENSDAARMVEVFAESLADIDSAHIIKTWFPEDSQDIRRYIPLGREDDPDTLALIFSPAASREQAELMVSHISYMRILGNYIGNSNWNNPEIFKKFRVQTNMMILLNDWAVDSTHNDFNRFSFEYQSHFGTQPGLLAFRGADGADFLNFLVKKGIPGSSDADSAIRKLEPFTGFTGPVWFNGQVSNQQIPLYRWVENQWIPYEPKGLPFY